MSPVAPEGWTQRRLGECADQRTEKTLPDATDTRRYVALEHLAQGCPAILGWFPAGRATSAKTVFRKGDVLFGKLRPNLRKAAAAPFDGLCSTDILPMFGKDGLETPYLLQLAQWDDLQQHAIATASGTKMPRTSWKQLAEFVVKLPPVAEQRKIDAILSSVDDVIEMSRSVIEQVQIVKRGLMQQLLTRPAGYTEHGWKHQRLRDCAWVNPEQLTSRAKSDFLMEYLDIAAIERLGTIGGTRTLQFADAPSRARRLAREGDILVSTVRPYLRNFARIREAPDNLVVSTGYAVIRPRDVVDGDFLYQHILSTSFVRFLKSRMSGSNYPAVAASDVEAYPMSLPSLAQQRKFGAILSSLDDTVAKTRAVLDRAHGVKEALLSVLLTGKLRVTPGDEAA